MLALDFLAVNSMFGKRSVINACHCMYHNISNSTVMGTYENEQID